MNGILECLKRHGEQLDWEIAATTGMSLQSVRQAVSHLTASGDVIVCRSIRYKNGKEVEALLCRVSGYIPPPSPAASPSRTPSGNSPSQRAGNFPGLSAPLAPLTVHGAAVPVCFLRCAAGCPPVAFSGRLESHAEILFSFITIS